MSILFKQIFNSVGQIFNSIGQNLFCRCYPENVTHIPWNFQGMCIDMWNVTVDVTHTLKFLGYVYRNLAKCVTFRCQGKCIEITRKFQGICNNIPWFFQGMYTFPEWIREYTYNLKISGYIHIPWLYTFPVALYMYVTEAVA